MGGGIDDEGLGEGMEGESLGEGTEGDQDPASPPVVETRGLDGRPEVASEDACSGARDMLESRVADGEIVIEEPLRMGW